jgi:hypothetical protein
MMTYPNPGRSTTAPQPKPLTVVVLIIVLCFQAGWSPQELQKALMAVMLVLVALAVVRASSARV